jgi:hypothetical protein
MHLMGHESTTTPSTLLLKGEEVPFELEIIDLYFSYLIKVTDSIISTFTSMMNQFQMSCTTVKLKGIYNFHRKFKHNLNA